MNLKNKISSLLFLATPVIAGALQAGDTVPADLKAKNQDGKTIQFSSFKGKYVLVFFYPKDDTPGCTREACALRDSYEEFKGLNTVVLGVSRQDEKSHKAFIAKHKLPFDLLVDTDGKLGEIFGVKTIPVVGFSKRQSLLIGPDGKIIKRYDDVDPDTHKDIVLNDLKAASGKTK
jgi:thioredoxin-dependent peroxiredoxin